MEQKNFFQRNMKWIIVVIVIVLLVGWGVSKFNVFVAQNEQITAQWAQVETQYQRRLDLIPNVEATVKGVAKQEQTVFGDIDKARAQYMGATTPDAKATAATGVESALIKVLAIAENYPVLQSSQSYRDLTTELEGTENRISVERMKYNDLVRIFDTNVQSFPTSIIAHMFGFGVHAYFNVPTAAATVPTVSF